MIIYPLLFGLSLIGLFILTRRYYSEAATLPIAELRLRLKTGTSIRSRIWTNFLNPLLLRIKSASLPAILRVSEYVIESATGLVEKLEKKLKNVADTIHGKAINLEISEKKEYWQNLNGARSAGQPVEKVEEPKKEEEVLVSPVAEIQKEAEAEKVTKKLVSSRARKPKIEVAMDAPQITKRPRRIILK